MKYTKEELARIKVCSNLLAPPADEVIHELVDEISRLQEAERWIPVSERLPEVRKLFNVAFDFHGESKVTSAYLDSGWWWVDLANNEPFVLDDVTHWRPHPQPPEVRG